MDANADSIKLSGLLTSLELFLPHFVDIDNESLPTGITILHIFSYRFEIVSQQLDIN